jgi:hypothetical protein
MAPPAWCSAEADEARGLGGDAVDVRLLLLFAEDAEKVERVGAEGDQAHRRNRGERRRCARRERGADTSAASSEDQERQRDARGELHADPRG